MIIESGLKDDDGLKDSVGSFFNPYKILTS